MTHIFPKISQRTNAPKTSLAFVYRHPFAKKFVAVLLTMFFIGASVPASAAPNSNVTITVHGGGLRTGATSVAGIPSGTVFTATALTGSSSGGPYTCTTTDASGTCRIVVPSGQSWAVEMTTVPAGYYRNPTLAFGSSSAVASDTYVFETGRVNQNVDVPGSNANGTYEDSRHASSNYFSGLLAGSLNDPVAVQKCGLNVALILDQSGSMSGAKQTTLKAAANDTIDALTGTPSQLAIYTFSSAVGSHVVSTSTATAASAAPLKSFISGLATPSGSTNWDVGINQVPAGFDIVLFLTDGAPTIYDTGAGSGSDSYFQYVEHGIFSANRVKSTGTRIVAVGIGLNGGEDNLRAVSGPNLNSDYYAATEAGFGAVLKALATGACSTQLTIQKQILDPAGNPLANSELSNDWTFSTAMSGAGTIGSTVTTGIVNGLNGFGSTSVVIPSGTTPTITMTESAKSGYQFVSAQCTVDGTNVATQVTGSTISFTAASGVPLACSITNQAVADGWTLTKTSNPTDGAVVTPGQVILYTLTAANPSAFSVSGKSVTDNISDVLDDATLGTLPSGVTLVGGVLTWAVPTIPAHSSVSVTYTVSVANDAFNATLHNVATPGSGGSCSQAADCTTTHKTPALAHLTLIKNVDNSGTGGTKTSSDWTLSAYGGVDGTTILDSASGIRHLVTPSRYSLSESLQQLGYTTTGVWSCVGQDPTTGKPSAAEVIIATGDDVVCTVINKALPSTWTISKTSDPADGTTVNPGSTINYTVLLTHTGGVMPANTVITDDLSGVLDHAAIASIHATSGSAALSGNTLTWNTSSFSGTATLTYSVVIDANAYGVSLVNVVTPPTGGSCSASCTTINFTPHFVLTKAANPANGSTVDRGQTITYTLHAHNDSNGMVRGATATDDLSGVLNNASLAQPLAAGLGLQSNGTSLVWTIPDLAPDGDAFISYSVVVSSGAFNAILHNSVTPSSSGDCPQTSSCTTSHVTPELGHLTLVKVVDNASTGGVLLPSNWTLSADGGLSGSHIVNSASSIRHEVQSGDYTLSESAQQLGYTSDGSWQCTGSAGIMPAENIIHVANNEDVTCTIVNTAMPSTWSVSKVSDPASGVTVLPGSTIHYTVTLTHTSGVMPVDTVVLDDLSGVLGHAVLGSVVVSSGSALLSGSTVTWHTGSFIGVATMTYSVTVDADAYGVSISNVVTPPVGGSCVGSCSTSNPTAHFVVSKSSSPVDGTVVQRGEFVFYTLHATNDSQGVVTNAVITDDLSDVLDDAVLVEPLAAGLSLEANGTSLNWTIASLAPGQTVMATYAVAVNSDAFNATLRNVVSPSADGDCQNVSACSTVHTTPAMGHLTLVKVVDNGTTGGTKTPADWTLSASSSGGTQISDSATGITHEVLVGDYTLSESAQLLGYSSDDVWQCTGQSEVGGMISDAVVHIGQGQNVSCSITNVAQASAWQISKTSSPTSGSTVLPGSTLSYSVTLHHTGGVMPVNTVVTDDLTNVLSHAVIGLISSSSGSASLTGSVLTWNTSSFVGTATLTYSVTVNADAFGVSLANVVTPPRGGTCVGSCTTTNFTPHFTISKTSDPETGQVVKPGSTVTYTLHATNDSLAIVSGAHVVDDASQTLNHANLVTPLSAGLTLGSDGTSLTWNVPTLSAGDTASVSYSVTVDTDAYASELTNVITPGNGGDCIVLADCQVTHRTSDFAHLTLMKAVINGDTGGVLTSTDWTLFADGGAAGSQITNSTSGVRHQIYPGTYTLSESAQQLGYTTNGSWTCEGLGEVGQMVNVNTVEVAPGQDVTCTITNSATASSWAVSKTSDPADGSTVEPDTTITYTVTLTHLAGVVPANAVVTDDLSNVLDHATLGSIVTADGSASVSGTTLTWNAGSVATQATLTYSVTVNSGAYGVQLVNVVTPPIGGICSGSCTTTHFTPHCIVAKTVSPASGTPVASGDIVTYTLFAQNDSAVTAIGGLATDDLSAVLDNATLNEPLSDGLSFDPTTKLLTWSIPDIAPSANTSVSYAVTVTSTEPLQVLHNVLTPHGFGDCASSRTPLLVSAEDVSTCETTNPIKSMDMIITKAHTDPIEQAAVDGSIATPITYELTVTNVGTTPGIDDAAGVVVTDPMISKLVLQLDSIVAPDWDFSTSTSDSLVATYIANGGVFPAGASSVIQFIDQIVPPILNGVVPVPGLENTACVATTDTEIDLGNNCSTDTTNVKWVAIDPLGACRNGTPFMDYAIPLFDSLPGEARPTIALVWWEVGGYTAQDRTIDVNDTAAMLAAGALRVDYIRTPSSWNPGDIILGTVLWPGAVINTAGRPTDWPGLTKQADGSWIVDPRAPFYSIRNRAVVEVRITNSLTSTYVPVSGISTCHPQTSRIFDPTAEPNVLPHTGFDPYLLFRGFFLVIGVAFVSGLAGRRRR